MLNHTHPRQAGFSLPELMISMTIGLVILAGMATLFVNNSRAADEVQKSNQQLESGRYAMQVLSMNARNAGYYGEFDSTRMGNPTTLPDPCSTTLSVIEGALPLMVQGYDNYTTGALSCLGNDVKLGTDVLVVRRTETCIVGEGNCAPSSDGGLFFQASMCNNASELLSLDVLNHFALDTNIANMDRHKRDCTMTAGSGTAAPIRRLITHIYFIANNDSPNDGIPTLKRAELGGTTLGFSVVPVTDGIENMQLEFGVDGSGDTDVSPDSFAASPATVADWSNVVAVKVFLLARNTRPTVGYTDVKTYKLGSATTVAAANDRYKRHVFQSMISLPNPSGRKMP